MQQQNGNGPSQQLISQLRESVKRFSHSGNYQSAAFWAEKVLFITNDPADAYERAKCLSFLKEYHRAAYTIKSRKLHLSDLPCLHIAAYCHFMEKNQKEALQLLDSDLVISTKNFNRSCSINESSSTFRTRQSVRYRCSSPDMSKPKQDSIDTNHWLGEIFLLKGKIYEGSDNRTLAQEAFKEALFYDVMCFEAFSSLTRHHMLTIDDEKAFLEELNSRGLFSKNETGEFAKYFYELQSKKYHKPSQQATPAHLEYLKTNVDVETALAERLYFNCDYYAAYELTSSILKKDAHHLNCLPIYIASLIEIDKSIQLFDIAHQLVDLYPESAISWFAVGCYYLNINKVEQARRYLSKATTLDNVFGPAWLAYGHSFSIEKEHDQAMAAFFRAYHLMPGCHLPLLFIAVEYGRADDCKLAEKFLSQAKSVAPDDPYVLHEYGVIHYRNGKYRLALESFKEAESILTSFNSKSSSSWVNSDKFKQKWEPLLNNIGHTLRRLGKYDAAIKYHNKALTLVRANPSTYSALGFLYYLKEEWDRALEYLNNALSLRHNDSISTSLLDKTIPKYNEALKRELAESTVSSKSAQLNK